MKLHCKFQPLVPFWSEDVEIFVSKFNQNPPNWLSTCIVSVLPYKKSLSLLKIESYVAT